MMKEEKRLKKIIIAAKLKGKVPSQIPYSKKIRRSLLESEPDIGWGSIESIQRENRAEYNEPRDIVSDLSNSDERWIFLHGEKGSQNIYGLIYKLNNKWYRISLPSELRASFLTTAYISSYRDPEKMLRITEYSWYGKLVKRIYQKGLEIHESDVRRIQNNLTQKLDEIFSDTTKELRKRLKKAIFHYKVSFKPGPYTKDDDYKSITLFINDGHDSPYYDKGSGIQSTLIIALFTYYCKHHHEGSSLLLIEEPENYLHPQGRRALEGELMRFVEKDENIDRQIILSTHSPEFIKSVSFNSLIRIHKNPGSTKSEAYKIKEIDDNTKRKFKQIILKKKGEMFFADGVILVEGGEEYLIPPLFEILSKERRLLDSNNISVIRVDGKFNFKNYVDLLENLGIKWVILTDLDFIYSGIQKFVEHITDYEPIIESIRNEVDRYVEEQTRDLEEDEKRRVKKIKRLEKLRNMVSEENVITLLQELKKIGIFVLKRGELEDYLTDGAKNLEKSKERRVIELALKLEENESDLGLWFSDVEEFKEFFKLAKKKLKIELAEET